MAIGAVERLTPSGVLAELRACDRAEREASARRLQLACLWADLHPSITDLPFASTAGPDLFADDLAVAADAVAEFAAVHGVATGDGRRLIAAAMELRDRLPQMWEQVSDLRLPAWKAELLAHQTLPLGDSAVGWVDAQVGLLGERLSVRGAKKLVLMARAAFEPDGLPDPAERRWVRVTANTGDLAGSGWVEGQLDVPDALDLEAAIRAIAADLAAQGSDESLDVRRAHALGILARGVLGQPVLPLVGAAGTAATRSDASPGPASEPDCGTVEEVDAAQVSVQPQTQRFDENYPEDATGEATPPEAANDEIALPEVANSDATCPEAANGEDTGCEVASGEVDWPEAANDEIAWPEVANGGAHCSEVATREVAWPEVANVAATCPEAQTCPGAPTCPEARPGPDIVGGCADRSADSRHSNGAIAAAGPVEQDGGTTLAAKGTGPDLGTGARPDTVDAGGDTPSDAQARRAQTGEGRPVLLYVHLRLDSFLNGNTADLAEVGTTAQLVTVDQVRRWCATAGRVTVRPVIDLNLDRCVRGYQPTDLMKEQIALRDSTCVFPHCTRPARPVKGRRNGREFGFDADHVIPYDDGGETDTANLAPLCRRHHRLKTHTAWDYQCIGAGEYLWQSPIGVEFLRTTTGTVELPEFEKRRRRQIA